MSELPGRRVLNRACSGLQVDPEFRDLLYHRVEVFVANEPGCEGTHVASAADFADGHVLATLLNKVRFYLPPPQGTPSNPALTR